MIIKDMFKKPINRQIQPVVKVEQNGVNEVKQELEEYVVTRELQKHLRDFFENYKKGIQGETDDMGVWISGFFGSGKSHFLKILYYLLTNEVVDGKHAIDYFIDDNKIQDPMLLADIKAASSVPTDVALFNIASKSEISVNQSKSAIVTVLQNVFNEKQGFSGNNPFIADLERKLANEGKYDLFKEKYKDYFGEDWTEARNEISFIQDNIVKILPEVTDMSTESARAWCEKAMKDYKYRVEDFVKIVKNHIDKQAPNYHFVFLIDEIGQYIGEDSNLMLNLQTVTEDLGTECKGKVWIVVTSQQDIDSITKVKGNDFSKIQGRFSTRLSLSSADVNEVIKKRILEKNEVGSQTLPLVYDEKSTIIKNLIFFNDNIEKKLYSDRVDFTSVYPFIPYQFNLLGSVLTAVRTHSSSGKHLADGERSMLRLCRDSVVKIMDKETGALVPFYRFYDALEDSLDHSYNIVIQHALDNEYLNPDHESDCFDVNVLKTLFLIKYVKEIKASVENITSLMVSDINEDRMTLSSKVEAALRRLVTQTLVQKNGDSYIFLTNEEQEINKAIRAQNVDTAQILAKVSDTIFEDIFDTKQYRHTKFNGKYSFPFNRVLDETYYKNVQNSDITLRILTPYTEESTDESTACMLSLQTNCVLVVLPEDRAFFEELRYAIQIEKYIRYDSSSTTIRSEDIKASKQAELRERKDNAKNYLAESLNNAAIYVKGSKQQSNSRDIISRINEALGKLVDSVYHKFSYLDKSMSDADINTLFKSNNNAITATDVTSEFNMLALADVKEYIVSNTQSHAKVSLKAILDRFTKAPYGFSGTDVRWLVAKLFKVGDISMYVNNAPVTVSNNAAEDIIKYITRKEYNDKLLIDLRVKANEKQKKAVREVMSEFFGITITNDDDDDIMQKFMRHSEKLKSELETYENNYSFKPDYPGKEVVKSGKKLVIDVLNIQYPHEFFNYIYENKDKYLDFIEKYEPIKNFFSSEQKNIFDKALDMMRIYDASKIYIADRNLEGIVSDIKAILKNSSPYKDIFKLPELVEKFQNLYNEILDEKSKPIEQAVKEAKERVFSYLSNKKCRDELQGKFRDAFSELENKILNTNNIADLNSIIVEADALKVRCINEIDEKEAKITPQPEDGGDKKEPPVPPKKKKTISIKNLNNFSSWRIESTDDVKKYIKELEDKLLASLEDDTILNVEF